MNKIKVQDIDFTSLSTIKHQGSKSIIYEDDEICYKILNGWYISEKELLYKKLMEMDGLNIDNVYFPIDMIVNDSGLVGFTLKKFKNSMPIYDKFAGRFVDFKELFEYIAKACQILREMHKNRIICQDLSFDNILVDDSGNVAFCDLDGCCYNGYESPFISMPMKKLIYEYRQEEFIACENYDRISMLVSFFYLIYNKYLYRIPKSDFEILSRDVETVDKAMIYVNILLNKHKSISDFPYFDELIVSMDDYVMDREKQFNLLRRILKK